MTTKKPPKGDPAANGAPAFLSASDILNVDDRPIHQVDMTSFGWPGVVGLQAMTGSERDRFEAETQTALEKAKKKGDENAALHGLRARTVVLCLVDPESGKRLFELKDIFELGKKNAAALDHLFDLCRVLNGIAEGDVAELVGKSGPVQSAKPGSGSE